LDLARLVTLPVAQVPSGSRPWHGIPASVLAIFGVAILAIGFVLWAHKQAPRLWPKLVWGIVAFNALVAMVTFDTNTTIAARVNADPTTKYMSLIESACHAGLFDSAPTGATVWSVQPHAWMAGGPDRAGISRKRSDASCTR
jgi:hypothetical protein